MSASQVSTDTSARTMFLEPQYFISSFLYVLSHLETDCWKQLPYISSRLTLRPENKDQKASLLQLKNNNLHESC
jgi:hypothetical protein